MLRLRRPRRRRIVVAILLLAFAIAGLAGARGAIFAHDHARAATLEDALRHFRQNTHEAQSLEGVYTATTTGREALDVLGGAHHRYPAQTTLTTLRVACGLRIDWRALQARGNTWTLCSTPAGVELTTSSEQHHFFFQTDTTTYACTGVVLVPAKGVTTAPRSFRCTTHKGLEVGTVTTLGRESVVVDGHTIVAEHARTTGTVSGANTGVETADWWLDVSTALPVRIVLKSRSARKTMVGVAHYTEDADLRLDTLTPETLTVGVVAVTGATGHVGVNLCRALLAEGREVRAIGRRPLPEGVGLEGIEWRQADVRDAPAVRAALDGAEVVFHLAARISVTGDPDGSVWETNVEGTRNVTWAAGAAGVRRLIHASSVHALDYQAHAERHPIKRVGPKRKLQFTRPVEIDEEAPRAERAGLPVYGRSKAAAEAVVLAAVESGLDAVIVQPTAVIGPYDLEPSRMGRVLLAVARRRPLVLVPGGYDWVDVRDVAEGLLAAERAGRTGECYLLGGEWATLRRIARLVAHANGTQPPSMSVSLGLAERLAPLVGRVWPGAVEQGYTPEGLHALRHAPHVSHTKAAGQLGYQPRPLEETAADLVEWLIASGRLVRRAEAIHRRPDRPGATPPRRGRGGRGGQAAR